MTFKRWLESVEGLTLKRKPAIRLSQIDPDALRAAYDNGTSPVVFAKLSDLPRRVSSQKPLNAPSNPYTIPVLLALLVIAAPVAFWWRTIIEDKREAEVAERLASAGRIKLPVRTSTGSYMPIEATRAEQWVEQFIRDQMLDPTSAEFASCDPVSLSNTDGIQVEGEVYGKSFNGVRVRSAFKVVVNTRPRAPIGFGAVNRGSKPTNGYYVYESKLEGDGNTSVWRPISTGERMSNEPFVQSKMAAKRGNAIPPRWNLNNVPQDPTQ